MRGAALALVALLCACGAEPAARPPGRGTWSNARGFYAVWRPLEVDSAAGGDAAAPPPNEPPLNEDFTAEVWLFADERCREPIEDAEVTIDCRMPEHGHGMLRDVELVPAGGGRYLAEGMLCHMLGHWELYVDRTVGAVTERAQFDVDLE